MKRESAATVEPGVVWPRDVELFYNISLPTRLRWEQIGTLPARTVLMGDRSGWLAKDMPGIAQWLASRRAQAELVAHHVPAAVGVQML
jgi:hypothetical protein